MLAPNRALRAAAAAFAVLASSVPFARADIPVVELVGVVHAVSAGHVVAAIDRADAAHAPLVIVRIDTPGGLDTSMRQIVDKMLNCRTPVAVFVGPSGARAASAGFVIGMAADVFAMAPGTNIGAAHPVSALGPSMDDVMAKKVASDAAAYVRGKAERRGRNVELAEKAVLESQSFTDREAKDAGLIDVVARDVPELLQALEGREVRRFDGSTVTLHLQGQGTTIVAMNWRQQILSLIARPETLFLLLLGTMAGLGAEISHPGALFPGILGTLCLILFLFATQVLPVTGAGVLLILLAVALFAAEVKVHSYGLLTTAGLASMILGALMLVDSPDPGLRIPLRTLLPAAAVMAAGTILIVRLVVQSQRRVAVTGESGLVGQHGVADTPLAPEGWVRVLGERWHGVAEGAVGPGDDVTVTSVEGLTLHVRKGA